ncbi:PAS domain-containing sensor histidine kinase [Candidatus Manganitrophus noduliformans]|uniref:Oxygen sensor histidine kinase NreB n=1 Tax=Candidatus Manganitrophus noduliformans TaxID=2606439 RepID=A0A7X6DT56_9BACT|nr:PAS domain-containing sensor histidine kinase [Candidatus Manganitrophus noduliformans]NKE72916.1 PAS domain S-box protein [Candidatus Manganitrophus noduliformans]
MPKKDKKSAASAPARRKGNRPAVHRSGQNYRALLQNSPDVISNLDRRGTILFINRTLPEYTVENVIGTNASDYHAPEEAARFQRLLEKMFDSGEPQSVEMVAVGPTYWLTRIFPIQRGGKVESALVIATDMTAQKRTERALLESSELNRRMIEGVSAGIVQVAADGTICMANEKAQEILGLRFDALKKLYVADFDTKTVWEDGTPCESKDYPVSKCMETGRPQPGVIIGVRRPDGSTSWAIYSALPMRDPDNGKLSGAIVTFVEITERKRAEEALKNSRQQLRDLSARLQTILEEERTRISREIHDELGQQLTILKMDLSWLKKQLSRNQKPLRERTQSMVHLVDATIQTVRKISTEMRPVVLDDLGLTAAMEWQVEDFKRRTGMRCRFTARPEEITLDRDRSTTVFRIFQETLTNIVRHAGADKIDVRLEKRGDHLLLEVGDNGKGITEGQIANSKSLGLLGIRERALLWGGTVSIQGEPGKGTTLSVKIPLAPPDGRNECV